MYTWFIQFLNALVWNNNNIVTHWFAKLRVCKRFAFCFVFFLLRKWRFNFQMFYICSQKCRFNWSKYCFYLQKWAKWDFVTVWSLLLKFRVDCSDLTYFFWCKTNKRYENVWDLGKYRFVWERYRVLADVFLWLICFMFYGNIIVFINTFRINVKYN